MGEVVNPDLTGDEFDPVRPRRLGSPLACWRDAGQVHPGGGQNAQHGRFCDKHLVKPGTAVSELAVR